MTPLLFDIIIVLLVVLSLAVGFARGFCNEVFTIFGWIAAIVATIYFVNPVKDFLLDGGYVEKEWVAGLGGAAGIFAVTMGLCTLLTYFLTKTLHASKLGIIDRVLGFAFGVLRAAVLLGLAFLLFAYVFSDEDKRPDFVQEAQTRPILESSAAMVQTLIPIGEALDDAGIDEITEEVSGDETKEETEEETSDSYTKARKLIEGSQHILQKPAGLKTKDTADETDDE